MASSRPRSRSEARWRGRIAVALALALVAAQAMPVARDNPPVTGDVGAPPAIAAILRRACYDCHSNEVVWPWYTAVAPISWLAAYDVRAGRDELNFSTWDRYDARRRRKKLAESVEEIKEGEMAPFLYRLVHADARLDAAAAAELEAWVVARNAADR